MKKQILESYLNAGLFCTPLNGKPPFRQNWQTEKLTDWNLFKNNIGIITGATSGNLEVLDVDTKYDLTGTLWQELWELIEGTFPDVAETLTVLSTPSGGKHIAYRCDKIDGNKHLAVRQATQAETDDHNKTAKRKKTPEQFKIALIETRGEGGQVATIPTPKYKLIQGTWETVPHISTDVRDGLIAICKSFTQIESPAPYKQKGRKPKYTESPSITPWDDFDQQTDIGQLLESYGWSLASDRGNTARYKRDGGKDRSHAKVFRDTNTVHSFTIKEMIPAGESLKPSAVYAHYEWQGDFSAAAKDLYKQGYGTRKQRDANRASQPSRQPQPEQKQPQVQPHTQPEQQTDAPQPESVNPFFRILGFEMNAGGVQLFHFFQLKSKTLISLTTGKMSKSNLLMLAPLSYWQDNFGDGDNFSTTIVVDYIVAKANNIGLFHADKLRGRGAWWDAERVVFHAGDHLYMDGKKLPLTTKTDGVYQQAEKLKINSDIPLGIDDRLLQIMRCFNWTRKESAVLLAGWCVIAPIAGALNWRPHLWISGAAGSGKSWIAREVIRKFLNENVLAVQGNTSEAYVRNILARESLPVIFDEGEGETDRSRITMENVLALARASSTLGGGGIGKMSADGRPVTFKPNSCFCFVSIAPQMTEEADKARITVCNLQAGKNAKFATALESLAGISVNYVSRLFIRTLTLLPVLLKTIEVFKIAAVKTLGAARQADQIAPLLAGAHILTSNSVPSQEYCAEVLEQFEWDQEHELQESNDGLKCLSIIKQHRVRASIDNIVTIGELIQQECFDKYCNVEVIRAPELLAREGIRVDKEKQIVIFANKSQALSEMLKGTNYAKNHKDILLQIEDAQKYKVLSYAGNKSRGVALKFKVFK